MFLFNGKSWWKYSQGESKMYLTAASPPHKKVLNSSTNHNPSLKSVTCILPNEDPTTCSPGQKLRYSCFKGYIPRSVYDQNLKPVQRPWMAKFSYLRHDNQARDITSPSVPIYSMPRPTKQQANAIRSPRIICSPHLTHPLIGTRTVIPLSEDTLPMATSAGGQLLSR